jgi:hypothetical protein
MRGPWHGAVILGILNLIGRFFKFGMQMKQFLVLIRVLL